MKEYINRIWEWLGGEEASTDGYALYEEGASEGTSGDASDEEVDDNEDVKPLKFDSSDRVLFLSYCFASVIIEAVCKATDRMDVILLGLHSFVNTTGSDLFFEPRFFAPSPYEKNTTQPCEELKDKVIEIAESEVYVESSLVILTTLLYILAAVTCKSSCYKCSSKIFTLTCFTGALTLVIIFADLFTLQKTSDKHYEGNDALENPGRCSANILSDRRTGHTQSRLAGTALLLLVALIGAVYPFSKKPRIAADGQEAGAVSSGAGVSPV